MKHINNVASKHISGFSLLEMLMVVAVVAVLAMSAVPVAEIVYIRTQETLLENNLEMIRNAIGTWKRDARIATAIQLPDDVSLESIKDSEFYPNELSSLTMRSIVEVSYNNGLAWATASFALGPYLSNIPADPFVGGAVWAIHYASCTADLTTAVYTVGTTTGKPENYKGVFSISCVSGTARRGFETAIDGSSYTDW